MSYYTDGFASVGDGYTIVGYDGWASSGAGFVGAVYDATTGLVEIESNASGTGAVTKNDLTLDWGGTLLFTLRTTNTAKVVTFYLIGTSASVCTLRLYDSKLQAYNGSTYEDVIASGIGADTNHAFSMDCTANENGKFELTYDETVYEVPLRAALGDNLIGFIAADANPAANTSYFGAITYVTPPVPSDFGKPYKQHLVFDGSVFWAFATNGINLQHRSYSGGSWSDWATLTYGTGDTAIACTSADDFDAVHSCADNANFIHVLVDGIGLITYRVDYDTLEYINVQALTYIDNAALCSGSTRFGLVRTLGRYSVAAYSVRLNRLATRFLDIVNYTDPTVAAAVVDASVGETTACDVTALFDGDVLCLVNDAGTLVAYPYDESATTLGAAEAVATTKTYRDFRSVPMRGGHAAVAYLDASDDLYVRDRISGSWGTATLVAENITAFSITAVQGCDKAIIAYSTGTGLHYKTWDGSLSSATELHASVAVSTIQAPKYATEQYRVGVFDTAGEFTSYSVSLTPVYDDQRALAFMHRSYGIHPYAQPLTYQDGYRILLYTGEGMAVKAKRYDYSTSTWDAPVEVYRALHGNSHIYGSGNIDADGFVWIVGDGYSVADWQWNVRVWKSDYAIDSASWDGGFTEQTATAQDGSYPRVIHDSANARTFVFYRGGASYNQEIIALEYSGGSWSAEFVIVDESPATALFTAYPIEIEYDGTNFWLLWALNDQTYGTGTTNCRSVNLLKLTRTAKGTFTATDVADSAITLPADRDDAVVYDADGLSEYTYYHGDLLFDSAGSPMVVTVENTIAGVALACDLWEYASGWTRTDVVSGLDTDNVFHFIPKAVQIDGDVHVIGLEDAATYNQIMLWTRLDGEATFFEQVYLPEGTGPYTYPHLAPAGTSFDLAYGMVSVLNAAEVAYTAFLVPNTPSDLTFAAGMLTWTDNSNNELGFNVYKDGVLQDTTTETSYEPTESGTYTVKAYNAAGESTASNEEVVTFGGWLPFMRHHHIPSLGGFNG